MEIERAIEMLEKAWTKSVVSYRYQNPEKLDMEDALYAGIEALTEQLAHEQEPGGWIKCGDRMPEDGQAVLVYNGAINPIHVAQAKRTEANCGYRTLECEGCFANVTHWMPLPEPPKEEQHG